MLQKQLIGVVGAAVGFAFLWCAYTYAHVLTHDVRMPDNDLAQRLAFVARWLVMPGFTLLLGVIVAARRGFLPDAIDGTRTPSNHALEINLRYNQNTMEQVVLAVIAWVGLAATPAADLSLLPVAATTFCIGRVAFWIGYLIHPMGRAFGMVVTVVPTLLAYAWLIRHNVTS